MPLTISSLLSLLGGLFISLMTSNALANDKSIHLGPSLDLMISENRVEIQGENDKLILLDFWASWCGPCRESFPWMNQVEDKYKAQGFKVIAINLDQSMDEAQSFLKQYPAKFQLAFDPQGLSAESIGVAGMPTSFLIDRHGQIRERLIGFSPDRAKKHEQLIKELLHDSNVKQPLAKAETSNE